MVGSKSLRDTEPDSLLGHGLVVDRAIRCKCTDYHGNNSYLTFRAM